MYKKDSEFEEPPDDTIIWRYLDFTKFVSYLTKKSLFFVRSDKLEDKFEGKYSRGNVEKWKRILTEKGENDISESENVKVYNAFRMHVKINSWHMSKHESAAMWKLYLQSDMGLAIRSTFKRLKDCFHVHKDEESINIGKVKYVDYDKFKIPEGNLFNPFLYKRKSFEHEQELRAIILKFPPPEETTGKHILYVEPKDIGIYISADLNILIDEIVVSPTSPSWFKDTIKSVINQYALKKNIVDSDLASRPLY